VAVELEAQGDENAIGFTLNFDPNVLKYDMAVVGRDAAEATLTPNPLQADQGRLGIVLGLPADQKFAAGTRQILVVFFFVNPNTTADSTIVGFGDQPVAREAVDANANLLAVEWKSVVVTTLKKSTMDFPTTLELKQNFPNPFNPSTNIEFAIPRASHVTLKVFNLTGQEVATLVDQLLPAGSYKADWTAANLNGGVYFYQLRAGTLVQTKKLILLR
jgi:hypothetical protein